MLVAVPVRVAKPLLLAAGVDVAVVEAEADLEAVEEAEGVRDAKLERVVEAVVEADADAEAVLVAEGEELTERDTRALADTHAAVEADTDDEVLGLSRGVAELERVTRGEADADFEEVADLDTAALALTVLFMLEIVGEALGVVEGDGESRAMVREGSGEAVPSTEGRVVTEAVVEG